VTHKGSSYFPFKAGPPPGSPQAVQDAINQARALKRPLQMGKFYGPKERRLEHPSVKTLATRKARITLPRVGRRDDG